VGADLEWRVAWFLHLLDAYDPWALRPSRGRPNDRAGPRQQKGKTTISKFGTAIVPIVSIGVGVVLLSVAYAATNTDSAAQSPGPNPPALEKNERQMERATKVRVAEQKKAAKAKWARLARVKAEKARKAELARQEAIAREAARQAAIDRTSKVPNGVPQDWVPCGVTGAYCPPESGPPTCPPGTNYVPYAGKCVDGDW
jgi:hypothetical protein